MSWQPDWTIAPAAILDDWLEEYRVPAELLTTLCAPRDQREQTETLLQEVRDRKPLTPAHAALLDIGTGIPARMWLALEHNYRAGLAAGLTDAT